MKQVCDVIRDLIPLYMDQVCSEASRQMVEDINEYVPQEYLLEGFDATKDNPYEKEMMHKE